MTGQGSGSSNPTAFGFMVLPKVTALNGLSIEPLTEGTVDDDIEEMVKLAHRSNSI